MGTTWQSLAKLNHLTDPNLIFPNQVIQISSTGTSSTVAVRDGDGDFDGDSGDAVATAPAASVAAPDPAPVHTAPAPAPVASSSVTGGGIWSCIANHESGGNPAENTGNGFYGAFQFTASTWDSLGTGYARADLAPYSVQLQAAQQLQARSGWGQWPNTSAMCGA
ncbi:MAG: LysM peptidoglycan-binding domain-containing protein [Acidimicrobiaceae bacterium]|nr:LysM peptidoglycan-binding domain-containing protein [Acidimicrobiaceae bacterium]